MRAYIYHCLRFLQQMPGLILQIRQMTIVIFMIYILRENMYLPGSAPPMLNVGVVTVK